MPKKSGKLPNYLPDDEEARNHPLRKHRGWDLKITRDVDGLRIYDAKPPRRSAYLCPDCGEKSRVKQWRWTEKNYIDLPRSDKRVELRVEVGSFDCTNEDCLKKTFTESLDALNDRHHLTTDLANEILGDLRRQGTFSEVARKYDLNEQTLRSLEEDFVSSEDLRRIEEHTVRLPVRLGMHSCHLTRKNCCLLTNIDTERVFELIPSQRPEQIIYKLNNLFDRAEWGRVLLVSMPLSSSFRETAKKLFPDAKIFVPKNEIEKLANDALTALIRAACNKLHFGEHETLESIESACQPAKRLSKNKERRLRRLLELSPQLLRSYEQKELLLHAYALDDRHEKSNRFFNWRDLLGQSTKNKSTIDLLNDTEWQDAIIEGMCLSYSDYFQRIEQLIDLLRRLGHGYSIERIRGRLLYGEALPKVRDEIDKQGRSFRDETMREEQGASIKGLIHAFEQMVDPISPRKYEMP